MTLNFHIYMLGTMLNASCKTSFEPRAFTAKTMIVSTPKAHSEAWRLSVECGLYAPDSYEAATVRDWISAQIRVLLFALISKHLAHHRMCFLNVGCCMNCASASIHLCYAS